MKGEGMKQRDNNIKTKRILMVVAAAVWLTGCGSAAQKASASDVLAQDGQRRTEIGISEADGTHSHENTVKILSFGQQSPDCVHGAAYDVMCLDCGRCIETIFEEALGHDRGTETMARQPDCTGEGSITYSCSRCGTEWSEPYGEVQPHRWETVSGSWWEQAILEDGTPSVVEVPWAYERCSVCGEKKEGSGGE